jgi:hypothetical protein
MSPRAHVIIVLALAGSGCLQITPADGALHCSTVGSKCPSGYWCASDNTCWHLGHAPVVSLAPDMSVPLDAATPGPSDDGGRVTMGISCMMPSDCPVSPSWCLLVGCIGGTCALVAQPEGTVLPDNLQVPHDCQKLACNATGQAQPMADPTDMPLDPSGGCNTASCNGGSVTLVPTPAGTACTKIASGVCNGKGSCGACKPGDVQCASNTQLQTCSSDGSQWMNSMTCQSCSNANCVALCNAADFPQCNGNTQVTCVSGMTVNTSCANGCCGTSKMCNAAATCSNGAPISGSICDSSRTVINSCDGCGNSAGHACSGDPNGSFCLDDGDGRGPQCVPCLPGSGACCTPAGESSADGHQSCDGTGHWGACVKCTGGTTATVSCSGAGVCHCTADDPCDGTVCGQIPDDCGVKHACTCDSGWICNATTHLCHIITTTTTRPTTCTTTLCQ